MTVNRVPLNQEAIEGPEVVAQYDKYAGLYIMPEYKYFVWKILHRGIRSGRVLDVGTGTGRLAIELAKTNRCDFNIVGLDISEDMLKKACCNARSAGVDNITQFCLSSASALPFPDKSFDLVISYASLHHWFQPVTVLNEMCRVVKDTGTILIRDNRRVSGNMLWDIVIYGISLFESKSNRNKWYKAILASYTLTELENIIRESKLRNYRIGTDFVKFDLSIEATQKPQ
jgi:ubiquinone/menaquinone biosynthesis C-methylase UbiE